MSNISPDPDDSRPAPKKKLKFSYFEPIAGILFAVIATIIFLGFPQVISIVFIGARLIPTFDEVVIRSLWLPIIIWALLRIGIEVAYLVERSYTRRLATITVIGHILTAIVSIIIFISPRIVFWEYIDFVHTYFKDVAEWFGEILARPNLIILAIMLIVLVIESVTVIKKGEKAKKNIDEAERVEAEKAEAIAAKTEAEAD